MDLKETIKLIFDGDIKIFVGKRPTDLTEEDLNELFIVEGEYDNLTEEDKNQFMNNVGYILSAAEKMGMVFRNDVYNTYQHYIYSDDEE